MTKTTIIAAALMAALAAARLPMPP